MFVFDIEVVDITPQVAQIAQVAYCDPIRLVMRSSLTFSFVIDCMNQALARHAIKPPHTTQTMRRTFEQIARIRTRCSCAKSGASPFSQSDVPAIP